MTRSCAIEPLTVAAIMAHWEVVVERLDAPPILMGHSAGGRVRALLLDRGYGAVGVVINSAPTEGVRVTPLSQLKSSLPVLKNPTSRHRAVGGIFWASVLANYIPGPQDIAVDYHNDARPPLLSFPAAKII